MENDLIIEEKKGLSKAKKAGLFLLFTFINMIPYMYLTLALMKYYEDSLFGAIALGVWLTATAAAELIISKRLKISGAFFLMTTVSAYVLSMAAPFLDRIDDPTQLDLILSLFMYLSVAFVFKMILNAVTGFIMKNKRLATVCCTLAVVLAAVTLYTGFNNEEIYNGICRMLVGTPDQTGSWGSINQDVKRDENWKKIVGKTEFKLGEMETVHYDYGDENERSFGTYPFLDGSTVCVPMAAEFARQHLDLSDDAISYFVGFSTTHYAYENLIKQDTCYSSLKTGEKHETLRAENGVDLLLGTEPSDEELEMAKAYNVTLVKKPVCYDAFVFITHKDNPVDSLTVEQIKDIYSGKITNWSDVGGNNEKIVAYQREANSGSQTAMENLVMGGKDMIDPIKVPIIEGMGMLVDEVAEYQNDNESLGYKYRYYIDTLYKNDNIKTIAVEGIEPTDENIRSGKYPFTTNYYGVIRKGDEEKTGGKFLDWMLSDEGQKCIAQAGYITMR